ncbi:MULTISPECIES: hypothetical protein [Clostridiaceae]|uniref:Uncharacterized protein n=1 Tax=Clostridium facile TaxID=2763035 RepID=A0ABR7IQZ0_9CLOT|nr:MULTISPECIES: hypothetical protein [Clostridiaceae]MBC5787569.1 hypothetical protein [Clostridium facile]PWM99569.1 MAG: hypothetical protein DBX37_04155 [Massilioclostridium sp.]
MNTNKYHGNRTRIHPDETVVPLYDESFPATQFKKTKSGKTKYSHTEDNAVYLREFSIENEK